MEHVDVIARISQLYLLLLALIAMGALAWGANRLVFGNTTAETGWPILVGVGVVLVVIGLGIRLRFPSSDGDTTDDYPL